MSVKLKTLLLSITSFIVIIILAFILFRVIIFKYINEIEIKDLNYNFQVVQALLSNEENNINKTALDWAYWDDCYNFVLGKNRELFIKENLEDSTLDELNLDFMFFANTQGNMVYSITKDSESETKALLINKFLNKANNFNSIITFKNNSEVHSGILNVNGKIFVISSVPITTSDKKAKSNGSLIIGRYIDSSFINYVNSIIKAKINFEEIQDLNKTSSIYTIKKSNDYIVLYKPIKDIYGDASIISSISMNRDAYKLGKVYFKIIILTFFIIIALILFVQLIFIDKYILKRLKIVNEFMNTVAKTRDIKARINISGKDEIQNIGHAANRMLIELESAYKNIFYLSYSDKLTGLKNRAYIENKFEELDKKENVNYSIVMGDVNGLKLVNDTFGHKKGDRLICTIANILKSITLKDDIVARWGGDEFVILIRDERYSCLSQSSQTIQNIKNECERIMDFSFTVSIALGSAKRNEGVNWEEVMNLAEERMYRSKLTEAQSARNRTIISLEKTLYEKHSETEEHTQRIKTLSYKLGKKINLSEDKLNELKLLSLLHDIGKIGIPDHILMKHGKLTAGEWEIMKRHTEIGYRIAKATSELSHVASEILCHHERFDGTGYPQGFKGEEIPILSRIINVVDSFDVMTHKRAYKRAYNIDYAIKELKRCSGTQFDPYIVNEFIKLL